MGVVPGDSLSARVGAVWVQLEADVRTYVADEGTTPVTTFLVLGAICWTTAQFSAFSIFRYDRGGPAVMAIGTVLFLNVGLESVVDVSERLPTVPMLVVATFRSDFAPPWVHRSHVTPITLNRLELPEVRAIVTNLAGAPRWLYESVYCQRGQAENLIKMHKSQLASDRTSCRSPIANQVRLVLHTAAYWLMLTLRDAVPKTHQLSKAEFATLRLHLLKIGARVTETVSRVRLAFAAACPQAELFRHLAGVLQPAAP